MSNPIIRSFRWNPQAKEMLPVGQGHLIAACVICCGEIAALKLCQRKFDDDDKRRASRQSIAHQRKRSQREVSQWRERIVQTLHGIVWS
uniref:Uncharacterized protein n=1 Tax=Oryza brachyantha TaxID=4533 RepID=J3KYR4_ORYBR